MTRFRTGPPDSRSLHGADPRQLAVVAVAAVVASISLISVDARLFVVASVVAALFVIALRDLSIGVLVIVASVPVQTVASLDLGLATLTWTKMAVLATLAAWAVRIITGHSRPRLDGIGAALGCYVLVLALSIVEARNVAAWAEEVYRWSAAFAVYLIAAETLRSPRDIRRLVLVTAAAVLALSGYAAWQVLTGAGPETFSVGGVTRAYATFGEPNPFAGYIEMTVPLLIALLLGSLPARRRRVASAQLAAPALVAVLLAAISGTATLIATQSRGGYVGFLAGLGVVVWLTGGKVRWLGTFAAGICVLAVLISPYGDRVTARFRAESLTTSETQVTTDNFAAQERSAHWRAAVNMARSSPILGVGAGNFDERYRESTVVWRFRIPRGHAHNAYLQALAQAGLLGLLSYLTLLLIVARSTVRALGGAGDPFSRSVVVGVAAVTTAVALHNMVEYLHVLSLGLQLSVVWAALHIVGSRQSVTPYDAAQVAAA